MGDQFGPCAVPRHIEEKEWEALWARLSARPRDLELVARRFRRDENALPPRYVLQAAGSGEAALTSVLGAAAQEACSLGLIGQEQRQRYNRSGELGPLHQARPPPRQATCWDILLYLTN